MQPLRTDPWVFDDTADLPGDLGLRYEVVDGALIVGQPVTVAHQRASMRLLVQLHPQLPDGWEVLSEIGVRLGTDGRRSDGGIARRDAPASRRQVGLEAADFAMVLEVVSASSRKNDRFFKPAEYAAAGVPVFWRLEPEPVPRLHVLVLQDGAYVERQELSGSGLVHHPFALTVDLDALGL